MREGWVEAKLGDLVEKIGMGPFGSNIKVSTFVTEGVPIISGAHLIKPILTEYKFNYLTEEHADRLKGSNVQRGDLVLTHAGTVGQVSLVPENSKYERYVVSQRGFYVRPKKSLTDASYLLLFLKYGDGQVQLLSNINRTGVPSLSQPVTFTKQIKVTLPPIAEQRRIVDVVSSVDAYIDALQQQVDAARTARDAIEVSEFDNPKNEISLLGDHCDRFDIQVGPFGTQLHRHDYVPDGIPVVMPKDIIDGRISEANIARITTQKAEELKKHILQSGDVLFARRGDLSKRALVSDAEAGWLCGTGTVRVRSSRLGGALLFRLTNTSGVNAWLMDNSVGMTMPNLNTSIISAIPLRVPENPLEAISLLKTIDEFIQTLNVSLIRAKNLRSGLLSDLLSGEHEIPVSYDTFLEAA